MTDLQEENGGFGMTKGTNVTNVTNNKESLMSPNNFDHYFRIARMMSVSEMVPKAYKDKAHDILIAMDMGASLGLGPLQAIQNIAVINGRPCLYGDAMLAVCSGRPDFENIQEEPILDSKGKTVGFICTVKRRGRAAVVQSFTLEQAMAAGLWGKAGPWKQYPERMFQMRARAFALRDSFADALGGVRMAEEVRDYEVKDITPETKVVLNELIANKSTPTLNAPPVNTVDDSAATPENEGAGGLADLAKSKTKPQLVDKETGEVK